LAGDETLLQQAAKRVTNPDLFQPLIVIASAEHRFLVAEQLQQATALNQGIVLEPGPKNTAAAAAVAALMVCELDPAGLLLLMPADHRITDVERFQACINSGVAAAKEGALVLFGIPPTLPKTGYGYIRMGPPLPRHNNLHNVAAFIEKPEREAAERYIASGDHLWNSGIFLLSARTLIAEFRRHAPEILRCCKIALQRAARDADFLRLDAESFGECPAISVDNAIVEHSDCAAVIPADFDWVDVGSWSALWESGAGDQYGNVKIGSVIAEHSTNCYLRGEGVAIAVVGVANLLVIGTPDAVLVADRRNDQEVKTIVERLRGEEPRLL
jgi:mannose-1-phosphate guanylyltransferase/mannose-1-phosphate guanylyltransferase/mannose-6-phosphate isomerase